MTESAPNPPPACRVTPGFCYIGTERPCGKRARFYAAGWRCDEHKPNNSGGGDG